MKKEEKRAAADIVKLFREGKLDFSYFYSPLFTSMSYDHREDHQFLSEYNGVQIRLIRNRIIIDDRQSESNHPPSMDFRLTRELKEIYEKLYKKHEAEIKEVGDAQGEYKEQLDDSRKEAQSSSQNIGSMLDRLQS